MVENHPVNKTIIIYFDEEGSSKSQTHPREMMKDITLGMARRKLTANHH